VGQRPQAGAAPRSQGRGFGPAAKTFQARPSKTKQKRLDLLGFVRPNPDFSMGYSGKNKKIRSLLLSAGVP
jgi:hypothetical protein